MFFAIDPANGVAIYQQIVRQVSFAVAADALQPGDRVPSVRQLARQLTINPNTVARAYHQLQDERVLDSVRGTGLVVAPDAPKRCRQIRADVVRQRMGQVVAEARQSRLTDDDIRALVDELLAAHRPQTNETIEPQTSETPGVNPKQES